MAVTPGNPGAAGGGRKAGGKKPDPKKQQMARRRAVYQKAVTQLANALIDKGLAPDQAQRFAKVALAKPQGASIGKHGLIHFKGDVFNAKDFASTPLLDWITGVKAQRANEATLQNDPAYRAQIAQLQLTRDQGISDLEAQRRSQLLDFGDAGFVQNDPILAAAVKANQFSLTANMARTYKQNQADVTQSASRYGTIFGGGLKQGLNEAQRVFAGNQQDATRTLTDLLGQINMTEAQYGQNYDLQSRDALRLAQETLTKAGVLQPATPPGLGLGKGFAWFKPPPPPKRAGGSGGGGSGGGGANPPPPPPPPRGALRRGIRPVSNPVLASGTRRVIPPPPPPKWNPNQWRRRKNRLRMPPPPRPL